MHERYSCQGQQQKNRTAAYFEYPSTIAMMLREIRYGINLGFKNITINPFGPSNFTYDIGNIFVKYDKSELIVSVPGKGVKGYAIMGLNAGTNYSLSAPSCTHTDGHSKSFRMSTTASVNSAGILKFMAPVGCAVIASAKISN